MRELERLVTAYTKEADDMKSVSKLTGMLNVGRITEIDALIHALEDIMGTEEEMEDAERYADELDQALQDLEEGTDEYDVADAAHAEAYNDYVNLELQYSSAWDEYREIEE
jgi:hypothetical protein